MVKGIRRGELYFGLGLSDGNIVSRIFLMIKK